MAFSSKYDVTKGMKRHLKESGKSGEFSEQSFCTTVTANNTDWPMAPVAALDSAAMAAAAAGGLYRSASSVGLYGALPTSPQQVVFAPIPQVNYSTGVNQ